MSEIAVAPPEALFTLTADRWTLPFWDAATGGWLTACRCGRCGAFRMPPTPFCPECRSQDVEWPRLPGTGRLFSYTVVRRAVVPEMEGSLPYVPALIDLDEAPGARLISALVGCAIDRIRIGAPVRVTFEQRVDRVKVPRFRLDE
ncbi:MULTISPECIES: OB-fold domain-containing protein [unclassified Chelatococcus]|uniref:Zn-ribbon domain-containing OB-fold protein n=1 Tax=unclassified Chelatococcus TaxID=2638111 RepID=UPI001BCB049A|nr:MULTISPECIES: OB-fold domain-containing protein [unclassified Chelatococcus]MBS7700235.1 OB-fold domain-containing protein [Chelatococcus sp. YT9]MBX3558206.1 OB-fold domain-containing protein [Chelatococcus sp.]